MAALLEELDASFSWPLSAGARVEVSLRDPEGRFLADPLSDYRHPQVWAIDASRPVIATSSSDDETVRFAAAIAGADEVRRAPAPGAPPRCLLCQREVGLAVIVAVAPRIAGVCPDCRDAAAEDRREAVLELARVAARAEGLLPHSEISIALRRAIERLGMAKK